MSATSCSSVKAPSVAEMARSEYVINGACGTVKLIVQSPVTSRSCLMAGVTSVINLLNNNYLGGKKGIPLQTNTKGRFVVVAS
jgi:hypothetical protein